MSMWSVIIMVEFSFYLKNWLRQDIYDLGLKEFHCMFDTAESTHRPKYENYRE